MALPAVHVTTTNKRRKKFSSLLFLVFIHVPTLMCYISGDLYSKPDFSPWLPPSHFSPFVTSAHMGPSGKRLFSKTLSNFTPKEWQWYQTSKAFWTAAANITYLCITFVFDTVLPLWEPVFFFFFFSGKDTQFLKIHGEERGAGTRKTQSGCVQIRGVYKNSQLKTHEIRQKCKHLKKTAHQTLGP